MKLGELDIHIADKELDKERHEDKRFTDERIKDAKRLAATGTWPAIGRNDIYEKDQELYLVSDGCGVYKIGEDLYHLTKLRWQDQKKKKP